MKGGSSRHWQRTRKSEKKSQKADKPHSPTGKQAPVRQCGCLWGHLPSKRCAVHVSALGRRKELLTNGFGNVIENTFWTSLDVCVCGGGGVEWESRWTLGAPKCTGVQGWRRPPHQFTCLVDRAQGYVSATVRSSDRWACTTMPRAAKEYTYGSNQTSKIRRPS